MSAADRLGIEFISWLGMPPVEYVEAAARLGVGNVSIAPAPMTANPCGYPAWSLRDDAALRRDLIAALASTRVTPWFGEGILIRPGCDVADAAADFDLFAELGVTRVNTISIDPDRARGVDQAGKFAEMAAARGMCATLEYMPGLPIGTLAQAIDAIAETGCANLSVLVDCMHFCRSGGVPGDLAAVARGLIGHVQLCDVPMPPVAASYGEEALYDRLLPGDGALPLAEILAALSGDVTVGLELPMRPRAEAGEGPEAYLAEAVARTRDLLAQTEQR